MALVAKGVGYRELPTFALDYSVGIILLLSKVPPVTAFLSLLALSLFASGFPLCRSPVG